MSYLFLFLLFLTTQVLQAQDFSGEIVYKIQIIPTNSDLNLQKLLQEKKGSTATYVITDGYYKSTYYKDNMPTYSYTYHNETKKMYDDDKDSEYITFRDSQKGDLVYGESKVYKDSTTKILGYPSYLVKSSNEYGTIKTYYSDKVRVPFETFKDHAVGNWYNKLKKVNGAITLKTITTYKDYIEIQEAIKITKRKVERKEFNLPAKPLVASYPALEQPIKMQQPSQEVLACYRSNIGKAPTPHGGTKKVTSYSIIVVSKEGKVKYVKPYEKDDYGLHSITTNILKNCGVSFSPGLIGGEPVDAEVIFPIDFTL